MMLLASGCSESTGGEPEPAVEWVHVECDVLAPSHCGLPFPSNAYTIDDDGTPTGRRVSFAPAMMPANRLGTRGDPSPWSRSDGFSPGSSILVHLPNAAATGLPTVADLDRSLADDSPTILLDAETLERVPHFAELDVAVMDPERAVLFIRPAVRLSDATRYIVAIRDVVDESGTAIEPSPAFVALRDVTEFAEDPSVDARRPLYADIFARLGDAGIERETLQLAWDFTTASAENNTGWLLAMRDQTFAELADATPTFTITNVDESFDERVWRKIDGTFEVPLYLNEASPTASFVYGDDDRPARNGTATFEFELIIPAVAQTEKVALLQFGHGLLGTRREIESNELINLAQNQGYAIFASDWIGLTTTDQTFIATIVDEGRLEDFDGMYARLQQSMLNALVLMDVVARGVAADPEYQAALDPDRRYFYGISLGGIMGTVYQALSPSVQRTAVEVMGAPFSVLLGRSRAFDLFNVILRSSFMDPRDQQLVLAFVQMLWDRVEPSGYLPFLAGEPLPGSAEPNLLMRAAIGDHSVSPIGAHFMARTLGAPHLDTGNRDVWGLEKQAGPIAGTAYVEFDFGVPEEPVCALANRTCDDPHGRIRRLTEAAVQLDRFFGTGEIANTCPDGRCVYPELSGCTPENDTPIVCE